MSTSRRPRATALVEWEHQGTRGILVHADHKQYWLLPGGGLDEDRKTGRLDGAGSTVGLGFNAPEHSVRLSQTGQARPIGL